MVCLKANFLLQDNKVLFYLIIYTVTLTSTTIHITAWSLTRSTEHSGHTRVGRFSSARWSAGRGHSICSGTPHLQSTYATPAKHARHTCKARTPHLQSTHATLAKHAHHTCKARTAHLQSTHTTPAKHAHTHLQTTYTHTNKAPTKYVHYDCNARIPHLQSTYTTPKYVCQFRTHLPNTLYTQTTDVHIFHTTPANDTHLSSSENRRKTTTTKKQTNKTTATTTKQNNNKIKPHTHTTTTPPPPPPVQPFQNIARRTGLVDGLYPERDRIYYYFGYF